MTVIAVTASRTSPGATSLAAGLALALSASFDRSLLIEADPAGGVLSLRFGLEVTPSLTTFGSDIRNGYSHDLVWSNTQDLRGAHCIPAPVDPRLARSWVERVSPVLTNHIRTIGAPVVVDLGWVSEDGPSLGLAKAADVTLVVTRPQIAEIQALLFQVRQLQASGAIVGLVTVGTGPNDPQEVASVAGIPLVAVLPDDPKTAAALRGVKFAPNKFRRSLLWRTIAAMADRLVDANLVKARTAEAQTGPTGRQAESPSAVEPADPAAPTVADGPTVATYVAVPPPAAYAELAPEALTPESPQTPAPPPPAVRVPTPPAPVVAHPPGPPPVYRPEPVIAEPVIAEPVIAEPVDIDLTFDPDQLDATKRMVVMPDAQLVLANGERRILTTDKPTLIGRHSDCEIVLHDSQVSRRHGRLTQTVHGWHYADLGSRNGSSVNGRPCTETYLAAGDELFIGNAYLIFETLPVREMECA